MLTLKQRATVTAELALPAAAAGVTHTARAAREAGEQLAAAKAAVAARLQRAKHIADEARREKAAIESYADKRCRVLEGAGGQQRRGVGHARTGGVSGAA